MRLLGVRLDDLKKESEFSKNTLFTYFKNVEKSKELGQPIEVQSDEPVEKNGQEELNRMMKQEKENLMRKMMQEVEEIMEEDLEVVNTDEKMSVLSLNSTRVLKRHSLPK